MWGCWRMLRGEVCPSVFPVYTVGFCGNGVDWLYWVIANANCLVDAEAANQAGKAR